jgi:hypothetical protein
MKQSAAYQSGFPSLLPHGLGLIVSFKTFKAKIGLFYRLRNKQKYLLMASKLTHNRAVRGRNLFSQISPKLSLIVQKFPRQGNCAFFDHKVAKNQIYAVNCF